MHLELTLLIANGEKCQPIALRRGFLITLYTPLIGRLSAGIAMATINIGIYTFAHFHSFQNKEECARPDSNSGPWLVNAAMYV